jgi:hypothetical protein
MDPIYPNIVLSLLTALPPSSVPRAKPDLKVLNSTLLTYQVVAAQSADDRRALSMIMSNACPNGGVLGRSGPAKLSALSHFRPCRTFGGDGPWWLTEQDPVADSLN